MNGGGFPKDNDAAVDDDDDDDCWAWGEINDDRDDDDVPGLDEVVALWSFTPRAVVRTPTDENCNVDGVVW